MSLNMDEFLGFQCQNKRRKMADPGSEIAGTLPETNIALESLGLEDEFSFAKASWQVLCQFQGV